MRLRVILLIALTITAIYTSSQLSCKLTIIQNNGNTDTLNKKISNSKYIDRYLPYFIFIAS